MIWIGLTAEEKLAEIARYSTANGIANTVVLSPDKFRLAIPNAESIEWSEIIQYKFFYRLLQEITPTTLVVVNECLRTQNRYDLTYNCLRHFLNQTTHQLIFQHFPIIDSIDDFMILFDFDTRSRWKREPLSPNILTESSRSIAPSRLKWSRIDIVTDQKTKQLYERERDKLFSGIGLKDPHTIPRTLHLLSGKIKRQFVDPSRYYLCRNARLGITNCATYKESEYHHEYTVLEFCHNFIDFADFLSLSRQTELPVMVADLKVDEWYWSRFQEWTKRIDDSYSAVQ